MGKLYCTTTKIEFIKIKCSKWKCSLELLHQDIGVTSAQNMLVFNGSKEYLVELNQVIKQRGSFYEPCP